MTRLLRPLVVPAGVAVLDLLPVLDDALAGRGPAWLPVPANDDAARTRLSDALDPDQPVDEPIALVVATSGSTGTPKGALLPASALRASGNATHDRLGGPGTWLLALPAQHIAGLQVLLRSVLAGTVPTVVEPGFAPAAVARAVAAMPGGRRYTALVPTQLGRALDDPRSSVALAGLDAVLVGGASTSAALRSRAREAGVTLVLTYGMSETCGGCVYDGVPLTGVSVRIDEGRIVLGGTTVAAGYRGRPGHPAWAQPGFFRTDDAGRLDDGLLTVLGRLDDAITTGGLTVVPQVVEAVLDTHAAVRESVVLGVPDPVWGQRVVAVVVPGSLAPGLAELRDHVGAAIGREAAPRELFLRAELPRRGPGKVDRRALLAELVRLQEPHEPSRGEPGRGELSPG